MPPYSRAISIWQSAAPPLHALRSYVILATLFARSDGITVAGNFGSWLEMQGQPLATDGGQDIFRLELGP